MVDNESSVDIFPSSILETAGVSRDRIVKHPIRVSGFKGTSLCTIRHIILELTVVGYDDKQVPWQLLPLPLAAGKTLDTPAQGYPIYL